MPARVARKIVQPSRKPRRQQNQANLLATMAPAQHAVPKEDDKPTMAPPRLQKLAITSVPQNQKLKFETSTWVGIIFHQVRTIQDMKQETSFLWLKANPKITVRTLKYMYFARHPLEDFSLKHIDYYPDENDDQVKHLLARSPFNGCNVVVLRAVEDENKAEIDDFDKREADSAYAAGKDCTYYHALSYSGSETVRDNSFEQKDQSWSSIKASEVESSSHGPQGQTNDSSNDSATQSSDQGNEYQHSPDTERSQPAALFDGRTSIYNEPLLPLQNDAQFDLGSWMKKSIGDEQKKSIDQTMEHSNNQLKRPAAETMDEMQSDGSETDEAEDNEKLVADAHSQLAPAEIDHTLTVADGHSHDVEMKDSVANSIQVPVSPEAITPEAIRYEAIATGVEQSDSISTWSSLQKRISELPVDAREAVESADYFVCEVPNCPRILALQPWTQFGPEYQPLCTKCTIIWLQALVKHKEIPPATLWHFQKLIADQRSTKTRLLQANQAVNMEEDAPIDHTHPLPLSLESVTQGNSYVPAVEASHETPQELSSDIYVGPLRMFADPINDTLETAYGPPSRDHMSMPPTQQSDAGFVSAAPQPAPGPALEIMRPDSANSNLSVTSPFNLNNSNTISPGQIAASPTRVAAGPSQVAAGVAQQPNNFNYEPMHIDPSQIRQMPNHSAIDDRMRMPAPPLPKRLNAAQPANQPSRNNFARPSSGSRQVSMPPLHAPVRRESKRSDGASNKKKARRSQEDIEEDLQAELAELREDGEPVQAFGLRSRRPIRPSNLSFSQSAYQSDELTSDDSVLGPRRSGAPTSGQSGGSKGVTLRFNGHSLSASHGSRGKKRARFEQSDQAQYCHDDDEYAAFQQPLEIPDPDNEEDGDYDPNE